MILAVGLAKNQIWGVATPLQDRDYGSHPHVDAMKVRLLSPCAKEHEGKDEPNPAIGKARQMQGMLAWLGGGFERIVPIVSARFEDRMEGFLPVNLWTRYLPVSLGGIAAPSFHRSESELRTIFEAMPLDLKQAIHDTMGGTAPLNVRRTLSTFATNARARGISSNVVQDQIKEVLSNAELTLGMDEDGLQLAAGVSDDDEWRNLRLADKKAIARRLGLLTVDDALNMVDRPYLFRNMLAPQISLRHGEDPYKSSAYDTLPWKVREDRLLSNLREAYGATHSVMCEFSSTSAKLAEWALGKRKYPGVPTTMIFVPEGVVVSNTLCTLRVPI